MAGALKAASRRFIVMDYRGGPESRPIRFGSL
jgi:hypothetical protein